MIPVPPASAHVDPQTLAELVEQRFDTLSAGHPYRRAYERIRDRLFAVLSADIMPDSDADAARRRQHVVKDCCEWLRVLARLRIPGGGR